MFGPSGGRDSIQTLTMRFHPGTSEFAPVCVRSASTERREDTIKSATIGSPGGLVRSNCPRPHPQFQNDAQPIENRADRTEGSTD